MWARIKSFVLILSLLGLIVPSACEKSRTDTQTDTRKLSNWKVPVPVNLHSIRVSVPANAELIFESHSSSDEPAIQVFGAVEADCDQLLTFTKGGTDEDLKLTVGAGNSDGLKASGAASLGPWGAAVVATILPGLARGRLDAGGQAGLFCFTLLSFVGWTRSAAACSHTATTIKVSLPSSVCFETTSESSIGIWPCLKDGQKTFTVGQPPKPTNPPTPFAGKCQSVSITVRADKHAKTRWTLKKGSIFGQVEMTGGDLEAFQEQTERRNCLANGKYIFNFIGDGTYNITVAGQLLITTAKDRSAISVSHTIEIGYQAPMNDRERRWLNAHNVRRKKWHEEYHKKYVPLQWSTSLAKDAKAWAEKVCKETCFNSSITRADRSNTTTGKGQGENMMANEGASGSWGKLMAPDQIVGRFIDREATWPSPENEHLTMALWRGSLFVGCGETARTRNNPRNPNDPTQTQTSRVQVCRYSISGNCKEEMRDAEGKTFAQSSQIMLRDGFGCGPPCPSEEGCYFVDPGGV